MKSPFTLKVKGNYNKLTRFLLKLENGDMNDILEKYAKRGLDKLMEYTPIDSGLARDSWSYKITVNKTGAKIEYFNSDIENDRSVILLLEYGHATKNGGWVEGIDIVDPALDPVFHDLVNAIRKEIENS